MAQSIPALQENRNREKEKLEHKLSINIANTLLHITYYKYVCYSMLYLYVLFVPSGMFYKSMYLHTCTLCIVYEQYVHVCTIFLYDQYCP